MAVSDLFDILKIGRSPSNVIKRLATVCQDYNKLDEFRKHFKYFQTTASDNSHVMAPVFGRMDSNEAYDFSCKIYSLLKDKLIVANDAQETKIKAELHYWDSKITTFTPWGLAGEKQRPIYTLYSRPNNELGIHKATTVDVDKALMVAVKILHPNAKVPNPNKIPESEKSNVKHAVNILNKCSYLKQHDSDFASALKSLMKIIK